MKTPTPRPALPVNLLLLLVFGLCACFSILVGARVYENIAARDEASFSKSVAFSYIANKSARATGGDDFRLGRTLCIREEDGGAFYDRT
jgi:hypothetical protein